VVEKIRDMVVGIGIADNFETPINTSWHAPINAGKGK